MKKEREILFLNALEENKEKLLRVCSIYSKDTEDTKDLFQEVLVNIWKSMDTFKGNSSLSTWMFRIALNTSLRFKSKDIKKQNQFVKLDSITIENFGAEETSIGENEKLFSLRKCVKQLNEGDTAVIALYLEGLVYKEISNILGVSENNIAVKIKRIKSKLLNCINKTL